MRYNYIYYMYMILGKIHVRFKNVAVMDGAKKHRNKIEI